LVGEEFGSVFATMLVQLVEVAQLGLALVELVKVGIFEGDTSVRLVDLHTKIVLNMLDRQVLSQ
jgi:hypothetical protein